MFTFLFLLIVGFGLFRIGKIALSNPGTSIKAATWLKDIFK